MDGRLRLDSAAGGALNGLGSRSPVWIPMVHDGLEMSNDYFSMSAGIVQNERPTTRSYLSLAVARVGMPLGDGKASVIDEQARLAKHITTQEDEAPSLSVEDVLAHYSLDGRIASGRTTRDSDGRGRSSVVASIVIFVSSCGPQMRTITQRVFLASETRTLTVLSLLQGVKKQ